MELSAVFDPSAPTKIVRDQMDETELKESSLGLLASPLSAGSTVPLVHGDFETVCDSRSLAIQSEYFRRHLSRCPSPTLLFVPSPISIDGLAGALSYMESGYVEVSKGNLSDMLLAAALLEIPQLKNRLEQYLRAMSTLDAPCFLYCWDVCFRAQGSVQLREEMMHRAANSFKDLYRRREWSRIDHQLVRQLFLRPDLKSASPTAMFRAAVNWVVGNPNVDPATADRIVSAVPFNRMTAIDRMKCLDMARTLQMKKLLQPRIVVADWHVTCAESGRHIESDLRPLHHFGERTIRPTVSTEVSVDTGRSVSGRVVRGTSPVDRPKPSAGPNGQTPRQGRPIRFSSSTLIKTAPSSFAPKGKISTTEKQPAPGRKAK